LWLFGEYINIFEFDFNIHFFKIISRKNTGETIVGETFETKCDFLDIFDWFLLIPRETTFNTAEITNRS